MRCMMPCVCQVLLDCANACVELARARQQQQAHGQEQAQGQQGPAGSEAPPVAAAAAAAAAAAPGGGVGPAGGSRPSWLGLPWLLVECYMYAALHAAFQVCTTTRYESVGTGLGLPVLRCAWCAATWVATRSRAVSTAR